MDSIAQDKAIEKLEERIDLVAKNLISLQRYVIELQTSMTALLKTIEAKEEGESWE